MTRKQLYHQVLSYFKEKMPTAKSELNYTNPYELLVAVILSAQCTDKRVNMITPPFFKSFPNAKILAKASTEEVYELIRSCSYPNNKSVNLIGMATTLVNEFGGIVPSEIEELQKMPGVGRKTANVIASVIYNKPTIAVDTHVFRVAERIGLAVNSKTPLQTELQLLKYIPEDTRPIAHHWLILFGRYTCTARKPACNECGLTEVCKYYKSKKKEGIK